MGAYIDISRLSGTFFLRYSSQFVDDIEPEEKVPLPK